MRLGAFVEHEFQAKEVLEKIALAGEGEAFGGGVDDSFKVEGGFAITDGDREILDALRVGAFEGIGDAEHCGELGNADAIGREEFFVVGVGKLWGRFAVVAGDEGDEEAVGIAEAEDLGMADNVEAMEFVGFGRDVVADFVKNGCDF